MIDLPEHPDFHKNEARNKDGELPCIVCGKGMKVTHKLWLRLAGGGVKVTTDEEAEEEKNVAGDMGYFPIGNCCLKKNPQLKPYVIQKFWED